MRVDLKGIHTTHATLADGTKKIYRYAWRGGPKLRGEPGSQDFIASYNEAVAPRTPTPQGRLQSLTDGYQQSGEFRTLRERTRLDYIKQIKLIEQEFGDFPLKALEARHARGEFMDWRDKLGLKSIRHMRGPSWRASCRGRRTGVRSPSIRASGAGACITARASILFGRSATKKNFSRTRPRICTCPCCLLCGPGNGGAISCG
jgi:hypothetical protein